MERNYSMMVDRIDAKTLKHYLRSPETAIEEMILLAEGEDLAEVARTLDCKAETRRKLGLALAERGAIRFAVEDPASVPSPWTPYAVALDSVEDDRPCQVIYAPPAYYVKLERD